MNPSNEKNRKGPTRQQRIEWMSTGWQNVRPDAIVVTTACLRRRYRGGSSRGVMWCVWQRSFEKDGEAIQPAVRWIECVPLRRVAGRGWACEDYTELGHLTYYSCPLEYLALVPPVDAEWRKKVLEHHAKLAERRRKGRVRLQSLGGKA